MSLRRILCVFGLHDWKKTPTFFERCSRCGCGRWMENGKLFQWYTRETMNEMAIEHIAFGNHVEQEKKESATK